MTVEIGQSASVTIAMTIVGGSNHAERADRPSMFGTASELDEARACA
jgi:hypothetical protein